MALPSVCWAYVDIHRIKGVYMKGHVVGGHPGAEGQCPFCSSITILGLSLSVDPQRLPSRYQPASLFPLTNHPPVVYTPCLHLLSPISSPIHCKQAFLPTTPRGTMLVEVCRALTLPKPSLFRAPVFPHLSAASGTSEQAPVYF